MSVGDNIKRLRESKSLTLTDLAAKTGMDEATCESIESGQRPLTSTEVRKLCSALEVTFDVLVAAPKPAPQAEPAEAGGSVVMPVEELKHLLGKMNE